MNKEFIRAIEDLEKEKEKTENGSRTQADILYPADD